MFEKIKNFFTSKEKILTHDSITFNTPLELGQVFGDITNTDSLYLQKAIEILQDAVNSIRFELFRVVNKDGDLEEVNVSPILDLLDNPNPLQTKNVFWKILIINLKLYGEAYIKFLKDGNGKIIGLLNLNSDEVQTRFDETKNQIVYTYKGKNYTNDDMMAIINPNPFYQLQGKSLYKSIKPLLALENKTLSFFDGEIENAGNKDSIMVFENTMDKTKLNEIKAGFFNAFNGKNKGKRFAPMSSGGKKSDFFQIDKIQINGIEYRNKMRDDIALAFGIPKSLITTDDINLANAEVGMEQFMKLTVIPLMLTILEVFNERMIIPFFDENLYLDTNELSGENKELLIKEMQLNGIFTINEKRERFGYDPIPEGDVIQTYSRLDNQTPNNDIQANTLPITRTNKVKRLKSWKGRRNLLKKFIFEKELKIKTNKVIVEKLLKSNEYQRRYIKLIDSQRLSAESLIKNEASNSFEEQKLRVLKRFEDGERTASGLFPKGEEQEAFVKNFEDLFEKIARQAGNVALSPARILHEKAFYNVSDTMRKIIKARLKLIKQSITETTYERVYNVITEKLDKGPDEVKRGLIELFEDMSVVRANTIARTESNYLVSASSNDAYENSNVVAGKQWLTSQDDKVRPEHVINDNVIVDKDGVFPNGESFPSEDSVNCRCVLAPVIDINNY